MLSNRWLVFSLLFATRTTIAYQFQSVASLGPLMVDDLGIGFGTLGGLIGCYMLPGIALALPGGLLDQRFGARRMLIAGLLTMMAGGVLIVSSSAVPVLFAGRIVSGCGAVIVNVVLSRTVSALFDTDDLAFVMGTFVASWPLGVALSLVTLPAFALAFGWKAALLIASLPCLVCVAAIALVYRDPIAHAASPRDLGFNLGRLDVLLAGVAGGIWGLYNAAYIVFVATMPDFFVERGLPLLDASNLASMFGWGLLASLPVGGYLIRRFGRPNLLMAICFLCIAALALALALTPATMTSFALLVTIVGLPAGAILAIPAKLFGADRLASAMGVFFTVFYVTLAVSPGAAGLMRAEWDTAASPLVFGAAAMVAACGLLLLLTRLRAGRTPSPR